MLFQIQNTPSKHHLHYLKYKIHHIKYTIQKPIWQGLILGPARFVESGTIESKIEERCMEGARDGIEIMIWVTLIKQL